MRFRSTLSTSLLTLALCGSLALTGCAAPASESGGDPAAGETATTRVVTTEQGDVTIPAEPQKVVLLNYALAGYLYDLDVPVAAMIPEDADAEGVFSAFWAADAEAQGTEFLPWSTDGFDMEAILALQPDLIVAGGIGFPLMQATKAYEQLTAIAPTVIVSGDKTEWQAQFEFLAKDVFAKPQVFDDAVAAYEARIAEVKGKITVPGGESVFMTFTADQSPFVLVEDQGLPKMFAELGFTPAPLFASGQFEPYTTGGDMFELSTEQVGQVITQDTVFVMGFNGPFADVATLEANPVYAALPAFQNGQAHDLPYWALRSDYDEAMAVLDLVEQQFAK